MSHRFRILPIVRVHETYAYMGGIEGVILVAPNASTYHMYIAYTCIHHVLVQSLVRNDL